MSSRPLLVVHGGAGSLPSEADRRLYLQGVGEALAAGLAALGDGAAEAVLAAVSHMEAHTIMNAGRGSALDADGHVRLDAGFMDGTSRRYGAVTGLRNCVHAARLAARLAEDGDYGRLVAPPASDTLAAAFGLPVCDPSELVTERALRLWRERCEEARTGSGEPARARGAAGDAGGRGGPGGRGPYLDTVGAVALDARGRMAAAVSTGGMSLKRLGRVGDSPIVGAGFWADDRAGACVTTGVGEVLLREGTARRCVQLLGAGGIAGGAGRASGAGAAADLGAAARAGAAAAQALAELCDFPGDERGASGLIVIDRMGEVALAHTSNEMSGGWARPGEEPRIGHQWGRAGLGG